MKESFSKIFERKKEFPKGSIHVVKKITIKNPKLKLIRNNLRTLLTLFAEAEYFRLSTLSQIYLSKDKLTNSQNKRFKAIREERYQLYWALTHSICSCAICGSKIMDMAFISSGKCWVCTHCLNDIIN